MCLSCHASFCLQLFSFNRDPGFCFAPQMQSTVTMTTLKRRKIASKLFTKSAVHTQMQFSHFVFSESEHSGVKSVCHETDIIRHQISIIILLKKWIVTVICHCAALCQYYIVVVFLSEDVCTNGIIWASFKHISRIWQKFPTSKTPRPCLVSTWKTLLHLTAASLLSPV